MEPFDGVGIPLGIPPGDKKAARRLGVGEPLAGEDFVGVLAVGAFGRAGELAD